MLSNFHFINHFLILLFIRHFYDLSPTTTILKSLTVEKFFNNNIFVHWASMLKTNERKHSSQLLAIDSNIIISLSLKARAGERKLYFIITNYLPHITHTHVAYDVYQEQIAKD
jgi:hypothetical protein